MILLTDVLRIGSLFNERYLYVQISLEVGRVPGDYPVLAMYCTTRHYPDLAGYYSTLKHGRMRGICHDFCDSQLYLTQ